MLGLYLRGASLGDRQLFRDEAASWLVATYPVQDIADRLTVEAYPPLYFVLLKGWMAMFGESEVALRSLSVAAAMMALLAGWRWAHEALGREAGVVALVLLAFSPLAIWNGREARMYALEAAFATLAWWLLWRLATDRVSGRRSVALNVAVLAAAVAGELWTLSLGLAIAALQGGVALAAVVAGRGRAFRRGGDRSVPPDAGPSSRGRPDESREGPSSQGRGMSASEGSGRRGAIGATWALAGVLLGSASFLPWLPHSLAVAANGERFWTPTPGPLDWASTLARMFVGWREDIPHAVDLAVVLLSIGALGLVVVLLSPSRARRILGWCLLGGVGLVPVVWAVSQARSIFDTRYLGASIPPLALAVAAGIAALAVWGRSAAAWVRARVRGDAARGGVRPPAWNEWVRGTLFVTALALAVLLSPYIRTWLADWRDARDAEPARQLIDALAPRLQPGDVLLARDARTYFPVAYQIDRRRDAGAPIPAPLMVFDSGREPFFRGNALIRQEAILERSETRAGWRRALPELGSEGDVWLLDLAFDGDEDVAFEPLDTGELRTVETLVVDTSERRGTARRLAAPRRDPTPGSHGDARGSDGADPDQRPRDLTAPSSTSAVTAMSTTATAGTDARRSSTGG